jgi:hypothetical protein
MISGAAIAALTNGTLVPIGVIMTVSMLACCAIYLWVRRSQP